MESEVNIELESITYYLPPLPQYESDFVKRKRMLFGKSGRTLSTFVADGTDILEELRKMSQGEYMQKRSSVILTDLSKVLYEGVNLQPVFIETASVLKDITSSAGVTVYMVDEALEEISMLTTNYNDDYKISYKIGTGTTVPAHVAFTKQYVKINDLIEDVRFPEGLGHNELTVKSVVAVPVMTPEDDCVAIFCMHRDINQKEYEDQHVRLLIVMCGWIGSTIYQNQQRLTLQKQQELNEYLLDLTKCYFADAFPLDKLITEVINFAKIALNAEHGAFYVIKSINDEFYVDYYDEGLGEDKDILFKKKLKVHLSDLELINDIVKTGNSINIRNAYTDARVHQKMNYITRSTLCIPIKGVDEILGVLQISNKIKGSCFTKFDEILFNTFSVYCGFVLSLAKLHEKKAKTLNINKIYAELLSFHMQPCIHDYYFVHNHPEVSSLPARFHQFDFYISETFEHYMPQLLMFMFNETCKDIFPSINVLAKFVLIVQKCYHNHPYHNFHHAFNVCHSIYNMLRRNVDLFTVTELRGLIISAYCHDVDHYGVTNNFLEITNHYLSHLYDESVLENHHYHVTAFIIKFMKLFDFLSSLEYKSLLDEIRKCILATDLATYFKRRGKLYQLCAENTFTWSNEKHKLLLKSIMMTMADLSGLCKPYNTAKILIDNVYKEFYNEGDLEKEMGLCPLSIMDREKANMIPADQVQFMTVVVLPCALILAKLIPNCGALYKEALKLRDIWQEINDNQGKKTWTLEDSLPEGKFFTEAL